MSENLEIDKEELLKKIERKLSHYKRDSIALMIADRVDDIRTEIQSQQTVRNELVELNRFKDECIRNKENYFDTGYGWSNVVAELLMKLDKVEESEREVLRANYCMQSNNAIFLILNKIYNGKDLQEISEYLNALKITISFYLTNYIFEKINYDLNLILNLNDEDFNKSFINHIDELLKKYGNDFQTIGEVLSSNYRKVKEDEKLHEKYKRMREYLISKGFDSGFESQFQYVRNSASHGEYYPDILDSENINILVDNNGKQKLTISLESMISFIKSKIDSLNENENLAMLINLLEKDDIDIVIENYLHDDVSKNELIKVLLSLSTFNTIQYNNQKHFRVNPKDMSDKRSLTDGIDLSMFFTTSYPIESRDNHDILETIKNAIGHMNILFENGIVIFDNALVNEQCSCTVEDLIRFITLDEIYTLTTSTKYYELTRKKSKEIRDKYFSWLKNNDSTSLFETITGKTDPFLPENKIVYKDEYDYYNNFNSKKY